MSDKIAMILNAQGTVGTLSGCGTVKVFLKQGEVWAAENKIAVDIGETDTPAAMRDKITALVMALDDCKVIAGASISGLAYHILNQMGFFIFEINGLSGEVLDGIAGDVEAADTIEATATVRPFPTETEEAGVYRLDLIALQAANPEISSKKALLSFLEETPFVRLELICSHLPPWLENDANLSVNTVPQEGRLFATITKTCCK